MDDVELKALAYVLKREMKKYHHEMDIYRGVLQVVKEHPDLDLDDLLADARQSIYIKKRTEDAFAFLEEWLPPIPDIDLQTVQKRWLENWKPSQGKPH